LDLILAAKGSVTVSALEEHQLDLGIVHGLVEREIDIDRAPQLDVHFRFDVGIDRQQIVGVALMAMPWPASEEHATVGALRLAFADSSSSARHLVAGEIGAKTRRPRSADIAKHGRHRLGIGSEGWEAAKHFVYVPLPTTKATRRSAMARPRDTCKSSEQGR